MMSVKRSNHKNAFTLLELIIVVVIMGLVYTLVSFDFGSNKKGLPPLSLETLPQAMRDTFNGEARSFLIYGDNCEKAAFMPAIEKYKIESMQFSSDLKVYTFDSYGSLRYKEFGTLRSGNEDLPVCFKYEIFNNQSTSFMAVESGNFFYVMPSFFGEVERFATMQEAQTAMLHTQLNPHELYIQRVGK